MLAAKFTDTGFAPLLYTLTVYSAVSPGLTVCALGLIDNVMFASRPESSAITGVTNVGINENNIIETSRMLTRF
ncbi:MAG: Uncharacterised protein [Methanobacteriota archaeon]|nr:MAG: Uncharacterised protein [Euryarchaeota archaeon]